MKTHVGVSPFLPVGLTIPQHCPFYSFLHPLLGPLFHCSPNPSLPQRHRKQCIVCPATKGNAETSQWPRAPSPFLSTSTPKPWGTWGFQTAKGAWPSGIPLSSAAHPTLFSRGLCWEEPPAPHWVWRRVRQGHDQPETSVPVSPCAQGWVGEIVLFLVTVLLKDYLVLVFVSPGQLCGGGDGGRVAAAPHFISKVLHLCDGVGWGRNLWCYRS